MIDVPYFVYHGANSETLGGTSAKGYWLYRRGSTVTARWGAVDVDGARGGSFRWRTTPNEKTWPFRTEEEARKHLHAKVLEKDRTGYDQLPPGRRIDGPRRR